MSQDIAVFHSSEIDTQQLPEGFYVGVMAGERCEEAVGPYPDKTTAAIAMTTKGGCVWLYGPKPGSMGYADNLKTYRFDRRTGRFA